MHKLVKTKKGANINEADEEVDEEIEKVIKVLVINLQINNLTMKYT